MMARRATFSRMDNPVSLSLRDDMEDDTWLRYLEIKQSLNELDNLSRGGPENTLALMERCRRDANRILNVIGDVFFKFDGCIEPIQAGVHFDVNIVINFPNFARKVTRNGILIRRILRIENCV